MEIVDFHSHAVSLKLGPAIGTLHLDDITLVQIKRLQCFLSNRRPELEAILSTKSCLDRMPVSQEIRIFRILSFEDARFEIIAKDPFNTHEVQTTLIEITGCYFGVESNVARCKPTAKRTRYFKGDKKDERSMQAILDPRSYLITID